jgi:hypothetical protein
MATLQDQQRSEFMLSAVDLFEPTPFVDTIESTDLVSVVPQTEVSRFPGQLIFNIEPSNTMYTSLDFILEADMKFGDNNMAAIANSGGQADGTGPLSAPISNSLMSCFSDVTLQANGSILHTFNGLWPYHNYVKTLVSTTRYEKEYV